MSQFNFEAIGTSWRIDIFRKLSEKEEMDLLAKVMARIEAFDKAYSRFRPDSQVTKMSKEKGEFVLPADAKPLMALYRDLYDRTGGLVTPLIGNLISDAGYDTEYSLRPKGELKPSVPWDEALEYDHPVLTIKKPVLLDFGAAGKGYLIDLVGEVLKAAGTAAYCIDAGGDILQKGLTPIRVGLEDPEDTEKVVGVYPLKNGSICGSAGNRRAWGNFTHIINPKTLESPRGISAVWVTAKKALIADAIATCLFFVPADTLSDAYDFEYALIHADRSIERSAGFNAEMFVI